MANPSEPDDAGRPGRADDQTEQMRVDAESEATTEIIGSAKAMTEAAQQHDERRFTAPSGFDGSTQKIDTPPDPETEVFAPPTAKAAAPQMIPPRDGAPPPTAPEAPSRRSWGWVIAVLLVIAALVAIAILGTVLLTRNSTAASSQEDKVRATIENFDTAVQSGDLATLRSITCGSTRDNYVNYDQQAWDETHARVAAAKQYPVVSSVDQVVVHDDHAEANVTTFMAYAPQTRSTRSFDLQFRDDQWKICQAPTG
ncbi:Rv0361 family membrane protein [Mycolicibacterium brisbanense]